MQPNAFLVNVVRPNVADLARDYRSSRHAFNAVLSADALAGGIYEWCKIHHYSETRAIADDSTFREKLAKKSDVFRLLRDMAKAQKHAR